MGYADNNLISGESITYRAKLHAGVLAKSFAAGILLDLIGVALVWLAVANREMNAFKYIVPALLLFLVSSTVFMAAVLSRHAAEFVVTNKRVIVKQGILHKQTSEIFLNKIETVGVDQTLTGRTLGYGTIVVRGTGGTAEQFDRIADPFEFRRQIQEQIGHMVDHAVGAGKM